jgi:hypothetical protein
MKRIPACLAAAAVALFCAAGARAENDPDDYLAAQHPYLRVPLSSRLPTSFAKLSGSLPLNDYDLSRDLPKNFLRIGEELKYPDHRVISGALPNSFEKISVSLADRPDNDEIARFGISNQVPLSSRLPSSFMKIATQYPTSPGN